MKQILAILLLFFSSMSSTLPVAVVPFENIVKNTEMDWLSYGVAETISNGLIKIPGFEVVERIQINKIIAEQELQLSGAVSDKSIVQIGELTGAKLLVTGSFQMIGSHVRLLARLVDAQTSDIKASAESTGAIDQIFTLQDKLLVDLVKHSATSNIGLDQNSVMTAIAQGVIEIETEYVDAYKHYGQALLLDSKNDRVGAVKELELAIDVDTSYDRAQSLYNDLFWSFREGNYWHYTLTKTPYPMKGKYSRTLEQEETVDGIECTPIKEINTMEMSGSETVRHITHYYYKGDDGIYWKKLTDFDAPNSKPIMSRNSVSTYSPPIKVIPYNLSVGDEWIAESSIQIQTTMIVNGTETKSETSTPLKNKNVVTSTEKVTIKNKEYDAYLVKQFDLTNNSRELGKIWYVLGIGVARIESFGTVYELDDFMIR